MRNHKSYSDEDKAITLALLESYAGNVTQTVRDCGIPATTIRQWRDGKGISASVLANSDGKKEELSSLFERVSRSYLNQALSPKSIKATKGKEAVIAACAATDKHLLLTGQATSIVETLTNPVERADKSANMIEEWKRRKVQKTA